MRVPISNRNSTLTKALVRVPSVRLAATLPRVSIQRIVHVPPSRYRICLNLRPAPPVAAAVANGAMDGHVPRASSHTRDCAVVHPLTAP